MKQKERLDVLLTEKGQAESRAKAQALIMSGLVYVDGQKVDKPGFAVEASQSVEVRGVACPYVSRGGLKLEKALRDFGVNPTGFVCSDSGASTGGFTDCLLQQGARKVFAIDVGYGQLAWKLRNNPRVINMERTNARVLDEHSLPEPIDAASIDVAFISLDKILPAVKKLLAPGAFVLALVKPQFEAGKEHIGKKGVVRDPEVHKEVIRRIIDFAGEEGFGIGGLDFSPVKGPEGNIEYLLYLTTGSGAEEAENTAQPIDIDATVASSHAELDK